MKPRFFATPADWRAWLEEHHATASELLVGFYKTASGKPSITWPESVDEALCFGWIDGVRRGTGEDSYTIRFTPRKAASIWSAINVAKVAALRTAGKMMPAGEAAFAKRTEAKTGVYSFERAAAAALSPDEEAQLRANAKALAFWEVQRPSYRSTATHWVVSAKQAETRARRLTTLIDDCAAGVFIKPLRYTKASPIVPGATPPKQATKSSTKPKAKAKAKQPATSRKPKRT